MKKNVYSLFAKKSLGEKSLDYIQLFTPNQTIHYLLILIQQMFLAIQVFV